MATRTLTHPIAPSIFIPPPDLLDIVKKNFHGGQPVISILWSILGSLEMRIASLSGVLANCIAADMRKANDGMMSYTDAMHTMDSMQELSDLFRGVKTDRKQMKDDLIALLSYRHTIADYLASQQERKRTVDWMETLHRCAQPQLPEQWKLDGEWDRAKQEGTIMTREEFDKVMTIELSGKAASWAKHASVVMQIIELADTDETVEFRNLPKRIQMQLLDRFARLLDDKVAREKKRAAVVKAGRSRAEVDATWVMNVAFWTDCALALTHHRYDSEREGAAATPSIAKTAVTPKTEAKQIAARIAKRKAIGPHADLVKESVDAANRAKVQAKLDAAKAKRAKKVKVNDLADIKKLDIATEPEVKTPPPVEAIHSLLDMPSDAI